MAIFFQSTQNWDPLIQTSKAEHSKVSKNFTLMGSFWAKYILFELKKYRGVISHDTEEWCNIWRKTDLLLGKWQEELGKFSPQHSKVSKLEFWWDPLVQSRKCMTLKFTEKLCVMTMKNDIKLKRNWLVILKLTWGTSQILTRALNSLKKLCFTGFLWPKYILFELQKYRRVIFHDTEELCKFWRRTDLWFEKRHEKYGKFSPEHLKVSKLGFWWDPLIQIWKSMSLKFTEELSVMTMKNDAKFEEELTCHFKTDMRNLMNFDPSTW